MSKPQVTSLMDHLPRGPIQVGRQRWLFIIISLVLLVPGLVFMGLMMAKSPGHMPLKLGIDFTGGTFLDIGFSQELTQQHVKEIRATLEEAGFPGAVVQLHEAPATDTLAETSSDTTLEPALQTGEASVAATPAAETLKSAVSIRMQPLDSAAYQQLMASLGAQYGTPVLLQKNAVGPTLAQELLVNGIMALVFAYVLIVGYLTFRFQFDCAVCAIVALLHDTLFVLGVFAALGYLFQVEVDSLFVTAILTVVGFSVHDTIVVFDRIRENTKLFYSKKLPFMELVNISVNQTLARSINTSLTALLPMGTLYLFGGETTKTFILAIILGVVVGTYSSICVASMLLVGWRARFESPQATTAKNNTGTMATA